MLPSGSNKWRVCYRVRSRDDARTRQDARPPFVRRPARVTQANRYRALAEKRLHDAMKAYREASDVRRGSLIMGRWGLAISYFDDPRAFELAAALLYEAVADAAGASTQEKDAFFAAYKRMRRLVCKLTITTNDANTRIDLGDGFKT